MRQTVFITGATSGIGKATAEFLTKTQLSVNSMWKERRTIKGNWKNIGC